MFASSYVATSGECLRGEGLVQLIGMMDTSPTGHFAYWTVRLLFGYFAYWTVCLLVISPTRHFAYWTFHLLPGQFAYRLLLPTRVK